MSKTMIYLDSSATTSLDDRVREAMEPYLHSEFGNASSVYKLGRTARIALEDARATVASSINAEPSEIIFTGSGTEANNHSIQGAIFHAMHSSRSASEIRFITSNAEHHSVLHTATFIKKFGVDVVCANVNSLGEITADELAKHLSPQTQLISLMSVNNEVGAVTNISAIAAETKSSCPNAIFHTDAVQALGKIQISVHEWGVDLASFSAHKIYGPKGIGALFIKRGVMIEPLLHGGAQERNRRGGTESVASAVGFAKACELFMQEWDERRSHLQTLYNYTLAHLAMIQEVVVHSPLDGSGAHSIINFSFVQNILLKIDGEALLIRFDLEGVAVSNGSACTSGSMQPSHVLLAIGKGEETASKSIRVSLSKDTTKDEIDTFISILKRILVDIT